MAGNQMVVRRIGEAGYGKNVKPPPYVPKNEAGVPQSDMRMVDGRETNSRIFDSNNEVRP